MTTTLALAEQIGMTAACAALRVARSRMYRSGRPQAEPTRRRTPSQALSQAECEQVRAMLNSERFMDKAPRQVILKSHSRPHTSDDNPFSEAQFKTVKYHADYPARFSDLEAARTWARGFFSQYNEAHYHSALNLLTPASVHYGLASTVQSQRQRVMASAYARHPTRFVHGMPVVHGAPAAVYINPPSKGHNLPSFFHRSCFTPLTHTVPV